jgi:16S rRNA (adenine1518-N6/adenine1519-N6)-dimethyltransferase
MDLTKLEDLQLALKLAGIRPKQGLGQHFLIDKASLGRILAAAELSRGDTVLEIGPGLGVMTEALAAAAGRVVAVETDPQLSQLLLRDRPPNLEVITADILGFDLRRLPAGYKVVANIPYYLTSQLLRQLLEAANPPRLMALLIQQEVAERICAGPGAMSVLALSVQYYAQPVIVGLVERHKFWPAPEVDSAILKISRRPTPLFSADPTRLFRLIKAGFGERRKQLKNSLAGGLNAETAAVTSLLTVAGVDPQARAQELAAADWAGLYKLASQKGLI